MRIDQFLPSFVRHDAISNHARQATRLLRASGYESDIWFEVADQSAGRQGRSYLECPQTPDGGRVILYHASTHSAMWEWLDTASRGGQRLALDYHNITPTRYFARWEPTAAASMTEARRELGMLVPRAGLGLADSAFNEAELKQLGHPNTAVCPILLDLEEYHQEPDGRTLSHLRRERDRGGNLWLFVGRIAPNKCQHDVLAAFAVYRRLFDPESRLALIGAPTSPRYLRALRAMATELDVAHAVEIPESAPFTQLLAYFQAADAFVCLSEHEGFCVPIIEAMELGLPVVAFRGSAVGETVAEGGVLVDDKDPLVVALAVDQVLADDARRKAMTEAGRSRAADFSLEMSSKKLLSALGRWIDGKG